MHFRYGTEWGGSLLLKTFEHYNYTLDDGPRINVRESSSNYNLLGYFSAYGGIATGERFASDVHFRYQGIKKQRTVRMLSFRENFYLRGIGGDGPVLFLQSGFGWGGTLRRKLDLCGGAGAGYRIALSRSFSLEGRVTLDTVFDHPEEIMDSVTSIPVSANSIRRSNVHHMALQFSIGLCFR